MLIVHEWEERVVKKHEGFAFSVIGLTLMVAPLVSNAGSVKAAQQSGDAALPGVGFANTNGNSGWPASGTEPQSATGASVAGVGFVAGSLTLNQVPTFDFGYHNLGSSETFPLMPVDSGYRPQLLSANAAQANAGVRALVVTDARQQMGKTTGYQVVLQFGPLQQASVNANGQFIDISGQPTTDMSRLAFKTDPAGNINTLSGATLQLSSATANPNTDWNQFLTNTLDFNNKAAIYPAFYTNSGTTGIVQPGASSVTLARLEATDAPAAPGMTLNEGSASVVFSAGAGKGFGTWAYDFTAASAATLTIPSANQRLGTWVSKLTWVLVDDPTTASAAKVIGSLH
ncbi:hypothetical protein L248_2255 [Schleiferilactobacillus shenzhenensis LY-73]|uniref:WxL domain-containing protein n=1 Tax=Schleiferilactobacillus shenzhenensis LY-73 TaxID=1231336 RepID=U4TK19_9LACO|nr:hypothetical protein L248_2255 [Schleiferilactobacillus shenzhenensis LY-73]